VPTERRVRRATVADAPTVARLIAELGRAPAATEVVTRMRSLPEGHTVLVAERGAAVVGFVHVGLDPTLVGGGRAQVTEIVVAAEHRGRGVGRQLLDEAATWAREHGCHHLWVRVDAGGSDAVGFHRANRFEDLAGERILRRAVEGAVDQVAGPGDVTVVPVRTTP
jgi:GNAT superfamily N-acetyltransferase